MAPARDHANNTSKIEMGGHWDGPQENGATSHVDWNPLFFMALSTGTRLGPYEVLSPIGAGGMG